MWPLLYAGGRVAQFAGRLLGGRDQFAKVLVGRVARHDQDVRNRKHGAYGREVGVGVIGQLVEQRRIDRQRVDVAVAEGRAVRARALDAGHADRAGRARLVLDDDIGVERLAQMRHRDARVKMSAEPPAADGMIIVMGLSGHVSRPVAPPPGSDSASAAASARVRVSVMADFQWMRRRGCACIGAARRSSGQAVVVRRASVDGRACCSVDILSRDRLIFNNEQGFQRKPLSAAGRRPLLCRDDRACPRAAAAASSIATIPAYRRGTTHGKEAGQQGKPGLGRAKSCRLRRGWARPWRHSPRSGA